MNAKERADVGGIQSLDGMYFILEASSPKPCMIENGHLFPAQTDCAIVIGTYANCLEVIQRSNENSVCHGSHVLYPVGQRFPFPKVMFNRDTVVLFWRPRCGVVVAVAKDDNQESVSRFKVGDYRDDWPMECFTDGPEPWVLIVDMHPIHDGAFVTEFEVCA